MPVVEFRPTSQSDSERHLAASARLAMSSPSRNLPHASRIEPVVIDCIHRRLTGVWILPISMMYWKMSSPSRPASHALMITSKLFFFARLSTCFRRLLVFSIGCSSNFSGIAGSTLKFHGRDFPLGPVGIFSSTRWPTADVMAAFSFSKYCASRDFPFFSNLPSSLARALDRSVATEGFSAIIRYFICLPVISSHTAKSVTRSALGASARPPLVRSVPPHSRRIMPLKRE